MASVGVGGAQSGSSTDRKERMMLKGKALQDRARELDIPMRSKMTADELRAAVIQYETVGPVYNPADLSEPEVPPTVRMAETQRRLNNQVSIGEALAARTSGETITEPMDNDTRERNYREQAVIRSGGKRFASGKVTPGSVKLTHRQKRRIRKNARKGN